MPSCHTWHPLFALAQRTPIREDLSHETSVEWDSDRSRLGYRCPCLGADQRQPNDAIAQHAVSDIGADGIDGLAYTEPSGEGAASRNASRERPRRF